MPALAWFCLAVAIPMTVWAYGPALDAPFVFDDTQNIVDSPALHWTEFSHENLKLALEKSYLTQRPVANVSFAIDHLGWGLDPRGFHITNTVIHVGVSVVLALLCLLYARVTTSPARGSGWATAAITMIPAAVYMVHPLNTQAVTYVVQRMTSLSAFFTLVALGCYMVARHRLTGRPLTWYGAALVAWILGLGTKEVALQLVLVIALYELCFFRTEWRRRVESALGITWNRSHTVAACAISTSVAVGLVALVARSTELVGFSADFPGRDFNGLERLMTQARVQMFYLSELVWPAPDRLNIDHDVHVSTGLLQPATTLPAILLWLSLLAGSAYLGKRIPKFGFPLLAYWAFHSIEGGPISLEMLFEHRMYLPSALLALAGAAFLADANPGKQLLFTTMAIAACVSLAGWTHARNEVWADPLEFHRDIAMKSPNKVRTQHNLALKLHESGLDAEALPVIQRAIALDPTDHRPLKVLGDVLLALDRTAEAIEVYEQAVDRDPANVRYLLGLGRALEAAGDSEAAFRHYVARGTGLGREGRFWEAITILKEAVLLRPDDAVARDSLGSAFIGAGLRDKAIEQFRRATELEPGRFEAWYNLGLAADSLGYSKEATRAYTAFIELAPPSLQKHVTRARTRLEALAHTLDQ